MKKRFRRITSALLSAALMFSCVGFSASAEQSNLSPDEQYIALMEATDWGLYDNHAINVQRAQIPDYLLNQMTTEQLVNAVLNYPLMFDLTAWNTYSDGFRAVCKNFNGLRELLMREDRTEKLLEKYQEHPIFANTRSVNSNTLLQDMYLDVLLAQPEF